MTARAAIVILCAVVVDLVFALAAERHGEALGWEHAEAHVVRCSSLATAYGYRYGLYDADGEHHCALYGEYGEEGQP